MNWCRVPVRKENKSNAEEELISHISQRYLFVDDELSPSIGLTFSRIDNSLPFIRMPRQQSLNIIGRNGMEKIMNALLACEKLRKHSLVRSDRKRIFADYGKPVMYTCAGVQVSRNSPRILDHAPFMEKLPRHHWKALMRLMRCAEYCFESIADHQVISHIRHAKATVPYNTMTIPPPNDSDISPSAKYFSGIAFGCNVFLRCHTDADFTMSIAQIHLKGRHQYELDDPVVVYFCFPTLGVAIPLRPGDFLLFNACIPHCILSRCNEIDEIMCVSIYLKSAIVGMNNNSLELTEKQAVLAKRYHQFTIAELMSPNRQRHLTIRYQKLYNNL